MNIVEWDDTLLTGNDEIDRQHQAIFRVANELHHAILDGKGQEMVAKVAVKLSDYSAEHFQAEERLMAECGYPQLSQHRLAHEKVATVVRDFHKTQVSVAPFQVLQFVISLIRVHIREVDAPMIRWVRSHPTNQESQNTNPGRLNLTD